uniref:Protein pelota homolog n=1 Tax=Plectus sambesii TaxID=2011161 RepID=A0A914VVH4_9BILA
MTIIRAKIDQTVPRKRKGNASQHDKGMSRFFDAVAQALLRHVNFDVVKCVLIASPGFVRDQFMTHLLTYAQKQGTKVIVDNRSKFMLTHSSSGFKHSLKEVLMDPAVAARLADTKAQSEVKTLEQFYEMLANDPARAYYGIDHVEKANRQMAIETLMLSDNLFRSSDVQERRRYVRLVESVRGQGGQVRIFSSLHISGEQLAQLTGVAAILRFPMPEIEDDMSEAED